MLHRQIRSALPPCPPSVRRGTVSPRRTAQVFFTTLGLVFFIDIGEIIAQMLKHEVEAQPQSTGRRRSRVGLPRKSTAVDVPVRAHTGPSDLAAELAVARADAEHAREDVAIYREALKEARVQLAEAQAAAVAQPLAGPGSAEDPQSKGQPGATQMSPLAVMRSMMPTMSL